MNNFILSYELQCNIVPVDYNKFVFIVKSTFKVKQKKNIALNH